MHKMSLLFSASQNLINVFYKQFLYELLHILLYYTHYIYKVY